MTLVGPGRGVAARQASLAASIEWSYRLLTEQDQRAFRALSVFPAQFTLAAAQAAAGADAGEVLARLVRRSMLVAPRAGVDGRSRYGMLETLRAYGAACLDETGEAERVRSMVAAWTVDEAEGVARGFETVASEQEAARWMDAEQENLRAVLDWALFHDAQLSLRLAVALAPWWLLRGRFREGRSLLEQVIVGAGDAPVDQVAKVERWIGTQAFFASDFDGAPYHFSRAIELLTPFGPSPVLVDSLNGLAGPLINTGRWSEAAAMTEQALDVARNIGYASGESWACVLRSTVAAGVGDSSAALTWARAANAVAEDAISGDVDRWRILLLGDALVRVGNPEQAENAFLRGLDLCRVAGDREKVAMYLLRLAVLEMKASRSRQARPRIDEALRTFLDIDERMMMSDALRPLPCGLRLTTLSTPQCSSPPPAPFRSRSATSRTWKRLRSNPS